MADDLDAAREWARQQISASPIAPNASKGTPEQASSANPEREWARKAIGMSVGQQQPGLVSSALRGGLANLESYGGATASALGGAVGYKPLQEWGAEVSAAKQAEAERLRPADVAVAPWREGGGGFAALPKWLAYTALEQAPLVAATIAGTALFPEAAVPAAAARLGAIVPEFLGGGGLRAGASVAARRAAAETGKKFAQQALGGAAVNIPVGAGSMYQEALERPGGPTQEDAVKALALSPIYGALEGAGGALGRRLISEATTKGLAATAGRAALRSAVEEAPTEAFQRGMELSFRPDLSVAEKASQIVDAAITGAAVGGVYGGAAGTINSATGGVRNTKGVPPGQLKNEDILGAIDRDLGLLPEQSAAPTPVAPTGAVQTAPTEAAPPPMMAQIEEATAPSEPEKPAEPAPSMRVREALADALGGQTKQNMKVVERLGDVDSLPSAVNRVIDLLEAGDAKKSTFKLANALGITDINGNPRNLDAEIEAATQRLTAAQIPQQRAELTAQLDRLETQRQTLQAATELRSAARPAEAVEEMLPPVARTPEAAPTQEIPPVTETPSAVQEPSPAGLYVQPTAEARGAVGERDTEGREAAGARIEAAPEGQPEAAPQEITPGAAELLKSVDAGGVPGMMTRNLRAVAKENGIAVNRSTTPNDVIDQLRAKQTAAAPSITVTQEAAPETPPTPEPSPVPQPPTPAAPPSPKAAQFMQQKGIKILSEEERAAARERQKAETEAYFARREQALRQAVRTNAARGGATISAGKAPKAMSPQEFLARRNRERPISAPTGLTAEPSQLDNDVLALVDNQASGKQILEYLSENSPDEITRMYAKHFTRLGASPTIQMADVNDPSLQLNREQMRDKTTYGSYNVELDRINLYERANAARVVMHEATHGQTAKAIALDTPAAQKVKDVFADFSARPEKFTGVTSAYVDVEEFVSEAFSNPQFQEYLKSQKSGQRTLWEKFKDAVFRLLRLPQSARSMFDDVIDLGNQLFVENAAVPREEAMAALERATESPMAVNQAMKEVSKKLDSMVEVFNRKNSAIAATRRALLGWQSITHMAARYGELFTSKGANQIQKYADYSQQRSAIAARFSQLFDSVFDDYKALEKTSEKNAETIRKVMALTEFNMDVRKSWDTQKWLHDLPNSAELQKLHNDARSEFGRLDAKTKSIFDRLEAINNVSRYAQMSLSLHELIVSNPKTAAAITRSKINPIDAFLQKPVLHENPAEAQTYWRETLNAQLAAAQAYIRAQNTALKTAGLTKRETEAIKSIIDPLSSMVDSTSQTIEAMKQSPNFHLGRFGDYMVAFRIRKDAAGKVDKEATRRVAAAVDAANVQAQISPEGEQDLVFIRVQNQEQAENLRQLALGMQKRGWLNPEYEPKAGQRTDESKFADIVNPKWLQQYLQVLSADAFAEEDLEGVDAAADVAKIRKEMVRQARELYLNMLPDNALSKILTERKSIPGYSKDMMRSFAFRHQVSMNAISNLATMHRISDTLTEMRRIVNAAKTGPVSDTVKLQNIFSEISDREFSRSMQPQNSFWDSVRAYNNAYFLSASPSYVLVNMTQPGTLLWPELAKLPGVGFVKAATTIAKVTPAAFRIMKASFLTSKSADAIITQKSLERSGVDKETAEFVIRVANTGNLNLGAAARELSRVVEGEIDSRANQLLRWGASAGHYSETLNRLIAALAARELYPERANTDKLMDYVNRTINETMLNYSSWNTARQTGKMGIAGEYTPVMFSFMTYQFQVMEKMYRELRAAFGGSREAQKFLMAHAAAITVLAGSLGLPFVSIAARAFDAIKDFVDDDDEPSDVQSMWRVFLAEMFGKDIGEVLARGAPRALGFDVSRRAGEADLLPFSRFITDRREIREVAKDTSLRALGSPISMALNIAAGLEAMGKGNYAEGFKEIMPNGFKGLFAAYQMAADGRFVDAKGRELPMTPETRDIVVQALGFTPQAKADYQEKTGALAVRRGILSREAANLRDQLADAIIDRTPERAELMQRAREYDRAHPDRPILKTIGATVRRRQENLAQSRATGLPLGVSPKDVGARELTAY